MKRPFIAVLLALLLILTGCSAEPDSQEAQESLVVYQSLPLPDLFVSIPEGYEETSSQFYDKYYIQDDATIIVTEDNDNGEMSTLDYSATALNQYYKITHTLEMIGDQAMYAGALPVEVLEFTYTLSEDSSPMSTMVSYCSDGYTMYIITCKCSEATYAQHRDEFLSVILSQKPDKSWIGAAENAEAQGGE